MSIVECFQSFFFNEAVHLMSVGSGGEREFQLFGSVRSRRTIRVDVLQLLSGLFALAIYCI